MRNWILTRQLGSFALMLCLTLGFAGGALAGEPASYTAALELAASEGKLVVVDFFTDW